MLVQFDIVYRIIESEQGIGSSGNLRRDPLNKVKLFSL
jgi:hypothetical protein